MLKQILSFPYQLVHSLRLALNFKQKKLPRPVISIGNISFGGTGKTPVTIAIAKYLSKAGLKVAVLTRGYKSKQKNFPLIVKPGQSVSVELTGDEAMEMLEAFSDFDIIVGIDPNRYRAGTEILKNNDIDIFILDDGMQHIALHRDVEILLKNVNETGFFREFPCSEKKADFVIYTKPTEDWLSQNKDKNTAIFNLSLNKKLDTNRGVGVFTAIADYKSLIKMIQEYLKNNSSYGLNQPIKLLNFPDHHYFTQDEVTQAMSLGINLITTQKDIVKIPKELRYYFHLANLEIEFFPEKILEDLLVRVKKLRG